MEKDHDVNLKRILLEKINPIANEQPSQETGAPRVVEIPDIKLNRIESSIGDEDGVSVQLNRVQLQRIQATESESSDYINIPLNGKWVPSVNPIHIGNNFRTLTNMRYSSENPVSVMGMTKINTTTVTNPIFGSFHYTKPAVVNSNGTTIRTAESHLIVQCFDSATAPTAFTLKQNITAIPSAGDFSATQLYPASSTKASDRAGSFSTCPNDGMVFCYGQEDCIWDGDESRVPAFIGISTALSAITDVPADPQDVTSVVNTSRLVDTDDTAAVTTFIVGSTRPLSGLTLYATASWTESATVTYFNGSTWASITDTEGGSGAKKTITWTASSYTPARKYIEGYFLYWYQVVLSGSKTLYHVTVTAPFGTICDTWDGSFKEIAAAFDFEHYASEEQIYDFTLNVLNNDDYLADDESSYWDMEVRGNGFDKDDCFYLGFTSEVCGIYFCFPDPDYTNTTSANMIIDYWTGSAWSTISNKIDGTSYSGVSFSKTGVVSFVPPGAKKISKVGSVPLVFYRVRFDADDVRGATRIGYIAGIPKQERIQGHMFAVHAADRLMLGCDMYENQNELTISAQDRPEVFNGTDSMRIKFGGVQALTGAAPVFAQYASNIYNIILVYKAKETWILQWNQSSSGTSWSRFCISPTIGCPSSSTLCTASVNFENDINQSKNIAIWRGHDGIYISNGQSPFCVSEDIKHVFDANNLLKSSLKVNKSMIYRETAFVDEEKHEYHWLWASGSSTTLNKEYVLDLRAWKWFEIVRNATGESGNELSCGLTVSDSNGNKYSYGAITGFMMRLEYGNTFDADNIESTLRFGEAVPYKNPSITSSLKSLLLTCYPKVTDTTITLKHYRDGDATGTSYTIMMDETLSIDVSPSSDWEAGDVITGQTSGKTCTVVSKISATSYKVKDRDGSFTLGEIIGVTGNSSKLADQGGTYPQFLISTNDFVMMKKDIGSANASFHGIELSHTSTASTKGFEPLTLSLEIQKGREK